MPFSTDQLIAIALSHHRAGRLADAEGIYRQILLTDKTNATALDYLGVLAIQTGRLDLAASLLRKSIASDPAQPTAHCNLGQCLRQLGQCDQAINCFREAIRLQPDLAVAHNNLGTVLSETRQFEDAANAYRKAIELNPDYADAHRNLANALKDLGQLDEALIEARIAIELQPGVAESHNTLGVIFADAGKTAESIGAYRRAIELNPSYAEAYSNLGNALAVDARHDEAAAASSRAVELDPRNVQSHWNLAVILLRNSDYARGWPEYEWRWTTQKHFPRPSPRFFPPRFPTPHWTGGDVAGETVFLHAEQGFGDTIHFCRYAPLLAARGARVVVEVHPELKRLMCSLRGVEEVIERGEAVPPFDQHCPMMSLPFAFGTMVESIPGKVPYLFADPEPAKKWNAKLSQRENAHAESHGEVGVGSASRTAVPPLLSPAESQPARPPVGAPAALVPEALSSPSQIDPRASKILVRDADPTTSITPSPRQPGRVQSVERLGGQCPPYTNRLRIGLCWAGSAEHADDRDRSITLAQFAPLAGAIRRVGVPAYGLPSGEGASPVESSPARKVCEYARPTNCAGAADVSFHSLQKGPAQAQAATAPPGMDLIDHGDDLGDWADTAALIANLDLVITVDTAVAHLAGAMGKPVWVLIRKLADWRWFIEGGNTPWYPSMRLFRQRQHGDWDEVIQRVADALSAFVRRAHAEGNASVHASPP